MVAIPRLPGWDALARRALDMGAAPELHQREEASSTRPRVATATATATSGAAATASPKEQARDSTTRTVHAASDVTSAAAIASETRATSAGSWVPAYVATDGQTVSAWVDSRGQIVSAAYTLADGRTLTVPYSPATTTLGGIAVSSGAVLVTATGSATPSGTLGLLATPTSSSTAKSSDKHERSGLVVGVIIGCIVFFLLMLLLFFCCRRRRRNRAGVLTDRTRALKGASGNRVSSMDSMFAPSAEEAAAQMAVVNERRRRVKATTSGRQGTAAPPPSILSGSEETSQFGKSPLSEKHPASSLYNSERHAPSSTTGDGTGGDSSGIGGHLNSLTTSTSHADSVNVHNLQPPPPLPTLPFNHRADSSDGGTPTSSTAPPSSSGSYNYSPFPVNGSNATPVPILRPPPPSLASRRGASTNGSLSSNNNASYSPPNLRLFDSRSTKTTNSSSSRAYGHKASSTKATNGSITTTATTTTNHTSAAALARRSHGSSTGNAAPHISAILNYKDLPFLRGRRDDRDSRDTSSLAPSASLADTRRSSAASSVASSALMSPSMLQWPMPPQTPPASAVGYPRSDTSVPNTPQRTTPAAVRVPSHPVSQTASGIFGGRSVPTRAPLGGPASQSLLRNPVAGSAVQRSTSAASNQTVPPPPPAKSDKEQRQSRAESHHQERQSSMSANTYHRDGNTTTVVRIPISRYQSLKKDKNPRA